MNTIKVISFDLDDTLWDNRPVMERAERAMQQALVTRYPQTHNLTAADWKRFRQQVPTNCLHDVTAARQHVLQQVADATGYGPELVNDVFAAFLQARSQVEPFADVLPTLQALRKDYQLIALTNGNVDIPATPLHDIFTHVITPSEAGDRKPNVAMFRLAEQRLDLPSTAFAHVGDSWETDVQGAITAGWQPVWFNPTKSIAPTEASVDVPPIQTISQLLLLDVISVSHSALTDA